jgi:hypothetical protein
MNVPSGAFEANTEAFLRRQKMLFRDSQIGGGSHAEPFTLINTFEASNNSFVPKRPVSLSEETMINGEGPLFKMVPSTRATATGSPA